MIAEEVGPQVEVFGEGWEAPSHRRWGLAYLRRQMPGSRRHLRVAASLVRQLYRPTSGFAGLQSAPARGAYPAASTLYRSMPA
ncbi:hypothetical protein A6F55_24380 [Prescottella equi]|nr:hypothetical protein A6F55_24380 [Prescottella equi]ORL97903.1 hypothetical protein A5N72_23600 [Prescottella equi]BCN52123.1 hypothetical protein RE9425_05130 [Prescottella equi]